MKAKSTRALSFLLLLILLFPVNASALWVAGDELEKVALELKKLHVYLKNLKINELSNLRGQQEDLLRQIAEMKQIFPQLQGAVEQNKSETLIGLEKTNAKLDDLAGEVTNQVLQKIHQQNKTLELFRQDQANLKEGLAQDIEKFEQSSKTNFQEFAAANDKTLERVVQQLAAQSAITKKGLDLFRTDVIPTIDDGNRKNQKMMLDQLTQTNMENQKNMEAFFAKNQQLNQELIKFLEKSLKQGLDTRSLLGSIKKDMEITRASVEGTTANLIVADEKMNILAGSLQAQNTTSNEVLVVLKAELEQAKGFNKLADEKLNKLIDLSSNLAIHSTELESSRVGQLKDAAQKEDARTIRVDLVNEELSRLIEILKMIAKEQEKLGLVVP